MLHALVVDATGGAHGVRDVKLLGSIAHKPQTQFGGKELYPGLFRKAAVLLEAIANYHVFLDGNKRTALLATARFLYLNGYELTASNVAVERAVLGVASKAMDIPALDIWLRKNTKKLKGNREVY